MDQSLSRDRYAAARALAIAAADAALSAYTSPRPAAVAALACAAAGCYALAAGNRSAARTYADCSATWNATARARARLATGRAGRAAHAQPVDVADTSVDTSTRATAKSLARALPVAISEGWE